VVRCTSDRTSRKTTRSTDCKTEQRIPPTIVRAIAAKIRLLVNRPPFF
jgi:hypothetical protein